jgi:hypothetical protein
MSLKLHSTRFLLPATFVGEEPRWVAWSGYAADKKHAFSKMMGDTRVNVLLPIAFGDELWDFGHTLFIWRVEE